MTPLSQAATGLTALATIVGTLYSGGSWVDTRYAHQEDLVLVGMRLEEKLQGDQAERIQNRMWRLEDRYSPSMANAPDSVKEEYRELGAQRQEIQRRLQRIEQQMQQQNQGNAPNKEEQKDK